MKMRLIVAAFMACLAGPGAFAQENNDATIAAKYSGENAVMTSRNERTIIGYEGGQLVAKSFIEEEIMLLTDAAPAMYNTSTIYHGFFHKISDIEATSLIPDKKGYKKVKATSFKTTRSQDENVFYDDAQQTTITYPSLVKGAKTHLTYTITHKDLHFLPSAYFQSYLPVMSGTASITAPKWVQLVSVLKGIEKSRVSKSESSTKNDVTYTWTATDMPKLNGYSNAPNHTYYITHLLVRIGDYTAPDGQEKKSLLSNTNDLYRFYYPFIKDVNKAEDENINKLVTSLTQGVTDPKEKAKKIYRWVQQNVRYVAYEAGMGGFVPREASLVCNRKFGDCKDMASLLVVMCRKAGLDAYFTWIGTRDKPYKYDETPLPVVDNHMICGVKFGDEWVFLDGTNPTLPFGIAPYSLQGKEALIGINEKSYKIVSVPETAPSVNKTTDSTHIVLGDAGLQGSINLKYTGYAAWNLGGMLMYRNDNEKDKTGRALTSRGSNKYILKDFDVQVKDDESKDVVVKANFELPDYARKVGNEWYLNMNLNRTIENTDDLKERKVPIEYDYKYQIKEVVTLDIPKGYHVSYLPPSEEQSVPDLWSYKIVYKKTDKQVQLEKYYTVNALYNEPKQFAAHSKLVDGLKKQFKESVVLTADN